MEYKNTLNLPSTDLPIKAKFNEIEPKLLDLWSQMGPLSNGAERTYTLHDGPPYPNGDIHLGHALNKILKDIVVKFRSMEGYRTKYIPGWDCHGLPIETQLLKELSVRRSTLSTAEFRQRCREYALRYVDLQRSEFKRLGIMGAWDSPYLTLDPSYEASVIELFGILAEKGYVYKSLKPIHWCPTCETALAEAEIEYEDDPSPSIFVKFRVDDASKAKNGGQGLVPGRTSMIIWTTTPWTLPSNVAIAVHPDHAYCVMSSGGEDFIVAEELAGQVAEKLKWGSPEKKMTFKGSDLEGMLCKHPFLDRQSMVVMDEFVSMETGSGSVHIAPGHGMEDFMVGSRYKLPVIMPVDGKGLFTDEVPMFMGVHVWKSNPLILELMASNGTLLDSSTFKHQYPHCWRCKKPVIFRATEQWFINVDHDDLRKNALDEIGRTKWYPAWGENRIRGMVGTRPDWCISRQRSWGIPIPAFYCSGCKTPLYKGEFNKAVVDAVKKEGTNVWFTKEASEILPKGCVCPSCGGSTFEKETDIMDVWLESGSSHYAVLKNGAHGLSWPADLYLEGSDQHRGWFQTSLLTSVAAFGRSPFRSVLTHGFTIDEKGKKMSKSLGNVVDPQEVVKEYGADVLRLWVASTDFRNDMAVSKKILKQVNESFSKIRNTCRFLLSNLSGFEESMAIPEEKLLEIDRYALLKLEQMQNRVRQAYDEFEFHIVYHSIYSYCVNDLSAFYLDIVKDRLYCDARSSLSRLSAQTVMHRMLLTLVKLMAPVLSFTAEDIYMRVGKGSVFGQVLPQRLDISAEDPLLVKWAKIEEIRREAYKKIEELRAAKTISQTLEAEVTITADPETYLLLKGMDSILASVMLVAGVKVMEGKDLLISVSRTANGKCERCWRYMPDIGSVSEHPAICGRCAEAVRAL